MKDHLYDPDWVIIDARFDIMDPEYGFLEYQELHIPNAIYVNLNTDLSGPPTSTTGRHPLPDPKEFIKRIADWGVAPHKQVVVYDTSSGSMAARLWWLLHQIGHSAAAVLDGGFSAWLRANLPTPGGIVHPSPTAVSQDYYFRTDGFVATEQIIHPRQEQNSILLDARSRDRFLGLSEPIDPIAGHIPGAINRFHGENVNKEGLFKDSETLRNEFKALFGERSPNDVIVYCGSGVTSIHHLLAMEIAGMPGARLYPGSWSEWIRDPNRPIATND